MPNLVFTYLEEMGDLAPTSSALSNASQQCSGTWLVRNLDFNDYRNLTVLDLLGFTDTRIGDGRIKRKLPARHPAFQWMFCDSVNQQGVGATYTVIQPAPGPGSAIIPHFPLYADYHYRLSFSPRQYNSWQDHDVTLIDATGYKKTGESYHFKYATEWHRFTTFDLFPTNQFITAQHGQMKFRVSGGVQPDGFMFQDAPKMYLPDSVLKVRWWEVPYRYVTSPNSYLRKFVGHVNQLGLSDGPKPEVADHQYPAGSLLYLGCTPTRIFTPPVPDEGLLAFNQGNGFTRNRLCDLELNFLYTARTFGTGSEVAPTYANRNRIVAGHNLFPWVTTRAFYYATSYDPNDATDEAKWTPMYHSFPFQLFFTDPDAQPGSPLLDP